MNSQRGQCTQTHTHSHHFLLPTIIWHYLNEITRQIVDANANIYYMLNKPHFRYVATQRKQIFIGIGWNGVVNEQLHFAREVGVWVCGGPHNARSLYAN